MTERTRRRSAADDKAWRLVVTETLQSEIQRLDRLVFHYPVELKSAGPLRAALDLAHAELERHAEIARA